MIRRFLPAALWAGAAAAQGTSREEKAGVPSSARPPAGLCRVWLKDIPAGQQPAPTDCASAIRRAPPSATILFGGVPSEASQQTRSRSGSPGVVGRATDAPARSLNAPPRGALRGPQESVPSRTMAPAPGSARVAPPSPVIHPTPPPPTKPPEKPQS